MVKIRFEDAKSGKDTADVHLYYEGQRKFRINAAALLFGTYNFCNYLAITHDGVVMGLYPNIKLQWSKQIKGIECDEIVVFSGDLVDLNIIVESDSYCVKIYAEEKVKNK